MSEQKFTDNCTKCGKPFFHTYTYNLWEYNPNGKKTTKVQDYARIAYKKLPGECMCSMCDSEWRKTQKICYICQSVIWPDEKGIVHDDTDYHYNCAHFYKGDRKFQKRLKTLK